MGEQLLSETASTSAYAAAYASCQADPAAWWAKAAEGIDWTRRWDQSVRPLPRRVSANGSPAPTLNVAQNCLDRHVDAGRGTQAALIWDSPMAGEQRSFTY